PAVTPGRYRRRAAGGRQDARSWRHLGHGVVLAADLRPGTLEQLSRRSVDPGTTNQNGEQYGSRYSLVADRASDPGDLRALAAGVFVVESHHAAPFAGESASRPSIISS